jgi:hypothetical protein
MILYTTIQLAVCVSYAYKSNTYTVWQHQIVPSCTSYAMPVVHMSVLYSKHCVLLFCTALTCYTILQDVTLTYPAIASHAHLLTPASKALLLQAAMTCDKPIVRVTVVTERETVLANTLQAMKDANHSTVNNGSSSAAAAIILNPYYKSSYSNKQITVAGSTQSVTVEEGEGLGPRKELFFLLAEQLQSQWQPLTVSSTVVLSAKEGSAEVKIQFDCSNVSVVIREGLQIVLDSGTIGTADANNATHHSCIITKVRSIL